ncbi:hypothetical protein Tco_0435207 [Tanacetum coccineum]
MDESCRFIIRTSLIGFPAQSVRSSNTEAPEDANNALDSPYLLVLFTGRLKAGYLTKSIATFRTVKVNQLVTILLIESSIHVLDNIGIPVNISLTHIESHKSPTTVLFDVDTRRISISHCEIPKSITLNVLAVSQG